MDPELDHLVVGCLDLAEGRQALEARLGVAAQGGGVHDGAGSHNALWGLVDGRAAGARPVYLELIAPDPAQDAPATLPFGLHRPEVRALLAGGPRLLTWMARCTGLDAWAARSAVDLGPVGPMRRGDLAWRLTRNPGPVAPLMGALPGLIEWPEGAATPSETLAGSGLTLRAFVRRADPAAGAALASLGLDRALPEGETRGAALCAVVDGPAGEVVLD